jgi:hypothetical protein
MTQDCLYGLLPPFSFIIDHLLPIFLRLVSIRHTANNKEMVHFTHEVTMS